MNSRVIFIRSLFVMIILIISLRLFSIQIINKDYKKAAENNIIHKIVKYPYRGLIYDRNDRLIVSNKPVYDVMIIPKEVHLMDSSYVMNLFGINHEEFITRLEKAKSFSSILPSIFLDKLPNQQFAFIQDKLINISGFTIQPRTVRGYQYKNLASVLGYVGEITGRQLRRDTTNYYRAGDNIGITGIERQYEEELRGKRGMVFKTVNVQGVIQGAFRNGEFDSLPVPGIDLHLTIDIELQRYAEKLMERKIGSVVAIEPSTGEVLAFVSVPTFDPSLLSGRDFSKNFEVIQSDTLKPLFNRPIQAMYPPGSMWKTVQSLIALQENQIGAKERIFVDGTLIGDLAPSGYYDVEKAIEKSSNNYFYKIFRRVIQQGEENSPYLDSRIGYQKWRDYVTAFGMGRKLGIDLPNEKSGHVPELAYYDRYYGVNRWKFSNIYSLSIGQGELLVTPLQMANLGAILANEGHYIQPHIVRRVGDKPPVDYPRFEVGIDPQHYEPVLNGMERVIKQGSGVRARSNDFIICGKTSTVQNPHGEDHSGFMGFAPKDNPQIAIAAYVENAGWGGRAAASTASLLMEKYILGEIKRTWLEDYVLKGDFADAK